MSDGQAQFDNQLRKLLVEADSYRGFLGQAFELLKREKGLGYAAFARRAGFQARSYPRDILLGKKRLTARAVPRFARALSLPADEAGLFALLVYREEPDLAPHPMTGPEIDLAIQAATRKLQAKLHQKALGRYHPTIYRIHDWPYVYAALGDGRIGATAEEVTRRTRLPIATCRRVLREMEKYQLVDHLDSEGGDRYRARSLNLYSVGLGDQASFQDFYFRGLERGRRVAGRNFASDQCFFFSSVFSVKRSSLPQLKERLRAVMREFVCAAEDAEGEELATLLLSFWPRSLESSPCE